MADVENGGGGGDVNPKRTARFKDEDEFIDVAVADGDEPASSAQGGVGRVVGGGGDYQEASLLHPQPPAKMTLAQRLRSAVKSELKQLATKRQGEGPALSPRTPPPPAAERKLNRSMTTVTRAMRGMQFLAQGVATQGWPEVERRFGKLAVDGVLLRSRFGQCIGMVGSEEFAVQIFDALARRRRITAQVLTKDELHEFWMQLSDPGFDSKLQTFFDMVDKNADGQITAEELKEVLTMTASANRLGKILERVDEYTDMIMEELDPDHVGYIEIESLEALLLQPQSQSNSRVANSNNASQLISQRLAPTNDRNIVTRALRRARYFLEDNWKRVWVMTLWVSACVGLFVWKFLAYEQNPSFEVLGYCVCVAKGGAETTKLNMAIILLPVCRNTITWFRSHTKIGKYIPFNDNINFHKIIAIGIAVGALIHIVTHLVCDFPRILECTDAVYDAVMAQFLGEPRPPNYWWFVKGVEGITGLLMLLLMIVAYTLAHPWFRRSKMSPTNPLRKLSGFNTFWYSHHLFVIVYIAFVVHGVSLYINRIWYNQTTWMYLAVPLLLYLGERVLRAFRSGHKTVKIEKVAVYPGDVMTIQMSKPHGFRYRSGQYMFVNCHAVSPFEWHPFSITSAPGDDYLSMHIRCRGDWTSRLRAVFEEICRPPRTGQSGLLRADMMTTASSDRFPKLLIDGPYGAPAQDYWKYDVLLLIGLGIGATPLISIVKDVLNHIQSPDEQDSSFSADHKVCGKLAKKVARTFMTKRAYFYWVTREEGSFDWFRRVMDDVAEKDKDSVIELHNHCTSVYEEGDARSALIIMLQALNQAKNGVDVVSGTRVRTHFARPNWREVFKQVAVNHENQRVGVFYCGDQRLTPELRKLSQDFTHKTTTKFVFHKENF